MTLKQLLYDQYVSSGQAGAQIGTTPDIQFATNRPYIENVIARHLRGVRADARIIDLGCGHGGWIHFLRRHGYFNVAGVDISLEQVSFAHRLGIADVTHGDLSSYMESQSGVDVVLLIDVLEHFTADGAACLLQHVTNAMNPGAKLLVHVPNGEGLFGQRIRYGDLTHEICYTPRSIVQLLGPLGFFDITCFEDRPIINNLKSAVRRVVWDLGTLYPRLLLMAESGTRHAIMSQNMIVTATRRHEN